MNITKALRNRFVRHRLRNTDVDADVYLTIEPYFSKNYYKSIYEDIERKAAKNPKFDPILHYISHGAEEGRDPHPKFSTTRYRSLSSHLLKPGQNPFYHYIMTMHSNQLSSDLFDTAKDKAPQNRLSVVEKEDHYDYVYESISAAFDSHFYLEKYHDVAEAKRTDPNFDPIRHYISSGWREGRDPSAAFSTADYIRLNSDVRHAGINPFYHYLTSGKSEGRVPKQAIQRRFPALDDSPRVLFVGHSGNTAGAELMLRDIIAWYADNTSYNIDVFILDYGPVVQKYQWLGNIYVGHNAHFASDIEDFPYRHESYSYIYCNTVASSRFSKIYDRYFAEKKIPIVLHVHEMLSVIKENEQQFRDLMPNVENYIAASDTTKRDLQKHFDIGITKITTVESFIRLEEMGVPEIYSARREARGRIGLAEDDYVIVGSGTVYSRKGPDVFVETLRHLLKENKERLVGIWIGDGPDYHAICNWIAELNLEDKIRFIGFRPDARRLIAAADLFFLPSREDPFPLVCLEAAQYAIPTVYFKNRSGIESFVRDDAGFIIQYYDANDAYLTIKNLVQNRRTIARAGFIAKSRVTERNNLHNTMPRLFDNLSKIFNVAPTLSVIVPNFNHARFLAERLESVLRQKYYDVEIILLDDASTDESVKILETYAIDPRCQLHINSVGSGSAFRQWEKGVSLARGKFVWIAESDDSCTENFLEVLMPTFNDSGAVIAYCQTVNIDQLGNRTQADLNAYLRNAGGQKFERNYDNKGLDEVNDTMGFCCTIVNASSAVIKKAPLLEGIRSAEGYKVVGDWQVYLLLLSKGGVCYRTDATNFFRRHSGSIISRHEGTDVYFAERVRIAQFVVQKFRPTEALINRIIVEFESEWTRFQHINKTSSLEDMKNCIWEAFDTQAGLSRSKKIAFYIHGVLFSKGGIERQGVAIANYLSRQGHNVTIYCRLWHGAAPIYKVDPQINVVPIFDETALATSVINLRRALVRQKIEVFIPMLSESLFESVIEATSGLRIKVVASEHNDPWVIEEKWWSKSGRLETFRKVDRIHLLLEKFSDSLPECLRDKVHIIPNGIPKSEFTHRRPYNVQSKRIIAIGRLEEQKNFNTLIKAFANARSAGDDWSLTIVGDGSELDDLRLIVAQLDLQGIVTFAGNITNVAREMQNSAFLAVSSHFEGFSIVTVEAMMAGIPVVAYESCNGPNELIIDRYNGLLCTTPSYDDRDGDAFAQTLSVMMTDDPLRTSCAANALNSSSVFDLDNVLPQWATLIDEI